MAWTSRGRFYEVRIVDPETDVTLPQGEIGEIVVRPKLAVCFKQGYYRMQEKVVEAWRILSITPATPDILIGKGGCSSLTGSSIGFAAAAKTFSASRLNRP